MVYGILVAAGSGTRIGFRKQYAELAGLEMWERSAGALMAGGVARVVVVVPREDTDMLTEKVQARHLDGVCRVTAGGTSRAESVAEGVAGVTRWMQEVEDLTEAWVAVHDAARPFVSADDVRAVVTAAARDGAAVLGRPCTDTMKRAAGRQIIHTVDRDGLWHAQTPQVFRLDWMTAALSGADVARSGVASTDDAAILEAAGYPVVMVPASEMNLKVTTADDLEFAQWIAERRWRRA